MWVGRSLRRFEDPALVRGEGSFVGDIAARAHDVSALCFVRSPVPRGRLLAIEGPDDALFFTAEDLQEVGSLRPLLHRPDFTPVDQPLLARGEVTFARQAIAALSPLGVELFEIPATPERIRSLIRQAEGRE
jgi:carbon-monoxide dehydrogenase large subunit